MIASVLALFAGLEGAVIILGIWIVVWLYDILAAQRKALNDTQTRLRLYCTTRDDSDRQVRALLTQNERLARLLIEAKVDAPPAFVAVPRTFFEPRMES